MGPSSPAAAPDAGPSAAGIGIAVGVYGVSFGVLAVAGGLSVAQACVMSMLVFTGASQFAAVGVLAGGGGALAAMGPAVVLALRNAAYGLSLAPILHGRLRRRALAAQLVIDETTAMARAEDDPAAARRAFLATGVSVWLCWNAGTARRRAARRGARRPAGARPRRDVPGGVPGAARAAAPPSRCARWRRSAAR